MDHSTPITSAEAPDGLVVARKAIAAARARSAQPSDGGGTGRSDSNDNTAG
jgi:hypothetical protein